MPCGGGRGRGLRYIGASLQQTKNFANVAECKTRSMSKSCLESRHCYPVNCLVFETFKKSTVVGSVLAERDVASTVYVAAARRRWSSLWCHHQRFERPWETVAVKEKERGVNRTSLRTTVPRSPQGHVRTELQRGTIKRSRVLIFIAFQRQQKEPPQPRFVSALQQNCAQRAGIHLLFAIKP